MANLRSLSLLLALFVFECSSARPRQQRRAVDALLDDRGGILAAPEGQVKLVVNSNTNYTVPWHTLYRSLLAANFTAFSDTILVLGGSKDDGVYVDDEMNGITVVATRFESFDLHGFSALYHHKDHPLVSAQVYVYLLDTSTVGMAFPARFASFLTLGFYEYRHPPVPSSNICVFGRGVLERYKTNFDHQLTKLQGLDFELGGEVLGVKSLAEFADNVTQMRARIEHGEPFDIYRTGHPRYAFWYPDLDVYKYILWGATGDLTGKVQKLEVYNVMHYLHLFWSLPFWAEINHISLFANTHPGPAVIAIVLIAAGTLALYSVWYRNRRTDDDMVMAKDRYYSRRSTVE